jgi:pyruvate dehydrogenase E2 component (dihydrolipoamide acetyltransferase)
VPIINPPEAAILGIGRIVKKPVVFRGKIATRFMMMLCLAFDHRVVDGAPAAAFLRMVSRLLTKPQGLFT